MAMLQIELGALADPLSKQLGSLISDPETMKRLDLMAKSIVVCMVHELIPMSVAEKARDRLMRKVKAAIAAEAKLRRAEAEADRHDDGAIDYK